MCISLEMRRDCSGKIISSSCRTPWSAYGDVEKSRRAISDARHECVAQHVQWHDEQSGASWILQRDEQERENRTAGVKALYSMLAATTSGRAKELVKQGLSDRNDMIASGRIRERFGKTIFPGPVTSTAIDSFRSLFFTYRLSIWSTHGFTGRHASLRMLENYSSATD